MITCLLGLLCLCCWLFDLLLGVCSFCGCFVGGCVGLCAYLILLLVLACIGYFLLFDLCLLSCSFRDFVCLCLFIVVALALLVAVLVVLF